MDVFLTFIVQFFKNSRFAMTILTVSVKSLQIKAKNLLAVVSYRCLTWLLEHVVILSSPVSIPGAVRVLQERGVPFLGTSFQG